MQDAQPSRMFTVVKYVQQTHHYSSAHFDSQIAHRYLLRCVDGQFVETSAYEHYQGERAVALAVDVSTMIGCPMRCAFCAAATIPLARQLSSDEMFSQFAEMVERHADGFPRAVCSFQGIGEPSLVAHLVLDAGKRVLRSYAHAVVSISTTGASLAGVDAWLQSDMEIDNLQFSFTGSTAQQRERLMPATPPMEVVITMAAACLQAPNVNKVKLNYLLIRGVNDSPDDAARVASRVRQTGLAVRIAALNSTIPSVSHHLEPCSRVEAEAFSQLLRMQGVRSYVYGAFSGIDVGCGQLAFDETRPLVPLRKRTRASRPE